MSGLIFYSLVQQNIPSYLPTIIMNFKSFQICFAVLIATMEMLISLPQNEILTSLLDKKNKEKEALGKLNEEEKIESILALQSEWKIMEERLKRLEETKKQLNETLIAETNLRLKLQAIVDFNQLVKGLFEECYPEWGEHRNDEYTDQAWHTMFLNIENERIIAIKLEMIKSGISEDRFIKEVDNFLILRNQNAHQALTNEEREKAYPKLLAVSNEGQKVVLASLLKFSYLVKSDNTVITKEGTIPRANAQYTNILQNLPDSASNAEHDDHELLEKITRDTKMARKELNLLIISNFKGDTPSEESLEMELDKNEETKTQACLVHENKVFFLFEDFDKAYAAFKHFNEEKHRFTEEKNAVIKNSKDFTIHKSQYSILKIAISESEFNINTTNGIKEYVSRLHFF
ncbi:uncharacterized protein LOC135838210 [Planococcus citri]|uniref:uncharacterized protein LOC135838210 n=1 Tax=Planococcus citri TaxID=170843 RepID=UPI0031F94ED3